MNNIVVLLPPFKLTNDILKHKNIKTEKGNK